MLVIAFILRQIADISTVPLVGQVAALELGERVLRVVPQMTFQDCRAQDTDDISGVTLLACSHSPVTLFGARASGSGGDGEIRVVESANGRLVGRLRLPGPPRSALLLPQGDRIRVLFKYWDGKVFRFGEWPVKEVASTESDNDPTGWVRAGAARLLRVSASGSRNSASQLEVVRASDLSVEGQVKINPRDRSIGDLGRLNSSRDGTTAAYVRDGGETVAIVDLATLRETRVISGRSGSVFGRIELSEDGAVLAAEMYPKGQPSSQRGSPHEVVVFRGTAAAPAIVGTCEDCRLAVSERNDLLVVASLSAGSRPGFHRMKVTLYRLSTGAVLASVFHVSVPDTRSNPWVASPAFVHISPDGRTMITSSGRSDTVVWSLETDTLAAARPRRPKSSGHLGISFK